MGGSPFSLEKNDGYSSYIPIRIWEQTFPMVFLLDGKNVKKRHETKNPGTQIEDVNSFQTKLLDSDS